MSESLYIPDSNDRKELYEAILPQISSLIESESDMTANLANIAAVLKETFDFFWVGFYLVQGDELVLGPFQGPLACTRIRKGKGVCGSVFLRGESIVVEDVEKFEGHIACSSLSRSEIVVPIFKDGKVWGVLDTDSEETNTFNDVDQFYMEKLSELISTKLI